MVAALGLALRGEHRLNKALAVTTCSDPDHEHVKQVAVFQRNGSVV
jgi:hypothetical protein